MTLVVIVPAGYESPHMICPDCGLDSRNPDGCQLQEPNGAPFHAAPSYWSYRGWYVHSGSPRAFRAMTDYLTPAVAAQLDRGGVPW